MTDLRDQVARAIALRYTHDNHKTPDRIDHWWSLQSKDRVDDLLAQADAALAVAEPIIRADERERLAKLADAEGASCDNHGSWVVGNIRRGLADWLRAQGGEQ